MPTNPAESHDPATSSAPAIRVSGASGLVTSVPYLLGFEPRDSFVVVFTCRDSGRVVLCLRVDALTIAPPPAKQWDVDGGTEQAETVVGELSLEGATRPVKGALSMAIAAAAQKGLRGLIVPAASAHEAAVVAELEVIAVESLAQAVGFLTGELEIEPTPSGIERLFDELSNYEDDFSDVRGQEMAKRAITIAAAGGHNILMIGPPGSGKTMLAKRVPTILPTLSAAESIETTRIYSAVGRLAAGQPLMTRRPFRDPHHTISDAGLVGFEFLL